MMSRFKRIPRQLWDLLRLHPASGPANVLSCQPFFVLSSGRSGSTLLRAILMQDPTVCIPPESHVLQQVCIMFRRFYRFLPWKYAVRLVVAEFASAPGNPRSGFTYWELDLSEFYGRAEALPVPEQRLDRLIDLLYSYYRERKKPEARRWGDKSLENAMAFPELLRLFPNARFIHLVRDGRDVVSSLMRHGITKDLTRACEYWRNTNILVHGLGKSLPAKQFLAVQYSDLVGDPGTCVKSICGFLDLDYTPDLLRFWENADSLGDTNRPMHSRLKVPIDNKAIGQWRKHLNPKEQRLVNQHLEDTIEVLCKGQQA